jgi:hypothetical protein
MYEIFNFFQTVLFHSSIQVIKASYLKLKSFEKYYFSYYSFISDYKDEQFRWLYKSFMLHKIALNLN